MSLLQRPLLDRRGFAGLGAGGAGRRRRPRRTLRKPRRRRYHAVVRNDRGRARPLRVPLFVLVRPRAGDFLYDEAECEAMLRDIEACVRLGCDGVVTGALDRDGNVDVPTCRELVAAAGALPVTFHRAFDVARVPADALDAVIASGCERVLTSGGHADALSGAAAIAALVRQAGTRLRIMAGAGVNAGNVRELVARSGVREVHASAKAPRRSSMRHRNASIAGLDADRVETDPDQVRMLAAALRIAAPP